MQENFGLIFRTLIFVVFVFWFLERIRGACLGCILALSLRGVLYSVGGAGDRKSRMSPGHSSFGLAAC